MNPAKLIKAIRKSFIGSEQVYTQGSCFALFRILKVAFPRAKPYWSSDATHCITRIASKYYDIGGRIKKPTGYKKQRSLYGSVSVTVAFPKKNSQQREVFTSPRTLSDWAQESL